MKFAARIVLALALIGVAQAQTPPPAASGQADPGPAGAMQQRLVPGMAVLTNEVLYGDVWRRQEISERDRTLVTISALIATGKTAQLPGHLGRTLTAGVTPVEASGVLTHLAVYCGWPTAVSALEVYNQVYTARKIDVATLRAPMSALPAPASEAQRARMLREQLGTTAPKFTELTNGTVFNDLWRRSDLTVRDRSLVTIIALAAMGDDDLLEPYLRRGVEAGLTRDQIAEAMTHLAFYAGWAKATKALTVVSRTLR